MDATVGNLGFLPYLSRIPLNSMKAASPFCSVKFMELIVVAETEHQGQDAPTYTDTIIATLRERFVVLDKTLGVKTAHRSFDEYFHFAPDETEGRFIYDLGNRQGLASWRMRSMNSACNTANPRDIRSRSNQSRNRLTQSLRR